jgi:phage terminase small subunit
MTPKKPPKTPAKPKAKKKDTKRVIPGQGKAALTARCKVFALHYCRTKNATASAIKAGLSPETAGQSGHRMFKRVEVQAFIQAEYERQAKDMEITNDRILLELARIGFADMRKAYAADGSLIPIHELDDNTAAAVHSFEVDEITVGDDVVGVTKKMKFTDKKGALELIMRHRGMLNDKLKLQGDAQNPLQMLLNDINNSGSAFRPIALDPEHNDAGDD